MRFTAAAIIGAALISIASLAFAKGPVSGEIQAYLVTTDTNGVEQVTLTDETEPGQVMEFRIVFTNNGDDDVKGIKVVDPIPNNTLFIGDSHSADVDARFEVSIDGGVTFEMEPVVRIETQANGQQKKVVVPPSQYTHVRWVAADELESKGGMHSYSYRVAVE